MDKIESDNEKLIKLLTAIVYGKPSALFTKKEAELKLVKLLNKKEDRL